MGQSFITGLAASRIKNVLAETLKEDSEGSKKNLPSDRPQISRTAKYYGFDGYFINQETTGNLVEPLGPKIERFSSLYQGICEESELSD